MVWGSGMASEVREPLPTSLWCLDKITNKNKWGFILILFYVIILYERTAIWVRWKGTGHLGRTRKLSSTCQLFLPPFHCGNNWSKQKFWHILQKIVKSSKQKNHCKNVAKCGQQQNVAKCDQQRMLNRKMWQNVVNVVNLLPFVIH